MTDVCQEHRREDSKGINASYLREKRECISPALFSQTFLNDIMHNRIQYCDTVTPWDVCQHSVCVENYSQLLQHQVLTVSVNLIKLGPIFLLAMLTSCGSHIAIVIGVSFKCI